MRYFNYEKTAQEAKISQGKLEALKRVVSQEFPRDPMMYELHMLRLCTAIRDGQIYVEDVLESKRAA